MRLLRTLFSVAIACLALPLATSATASAQYGERDWQGWEDPRQRGPWAFGADDLSASARQLAGQALELHQTARRIGDPELAQRSAQLARSARDFDRVLRSNAPPRRVMASFDELQSTYYELRGGMFELNRAGAIRGVSDEWARLAGTFERLALAIGADPDVVCTLEPRYGGRGRGYGPYGG